MAKTKMYKGIKYNIEPIKGENYNDCEFIFKNTSGNYKILEVDGQYFRTAFPGHVELDRIWWDSKGFKITER